jgi:glycosyltransferase involved in cell wall biosynthesis
MTVVVPVRGDVTGLAVALAGLAGQDNQPAEVLVVNAGRHQLSPAALPAQKVRMRILTLGPAFPGAARNLGVSAARTEWIALLDAGTQPLPGWLRAFRRAATAHPDAEILFGSYQPKLSDDWDWAAAATYLAPPLDVIGNRAPTTASLCIRKGTWQRIGGMRDDLRAGEDLLFFQKIAASPIPTATVRDASVIWTLPLLRMYGAGSALILSGLAYHPMLALAVALGAVRLLKNFLQRKCCLQGSLTPSRLSRLVTMYILADLATLAGIWDYQRGQGTADTKHPASHTRD